MYPVQQESNNLYLRIPSLSRSSSQKTLVDSYPSSRKRTSSNNSQTTLVDSNPTTPLGSPSFSSSETFETSSSLPNSLKVPNSIYPPDCSTSSEQTTLVNGRPRLLTRTPSSNSQTTLVNSNRTTPFGSPSLSFSETFETSSSLPNSLKAPNSTYQPDRPASRRQTILVNGRPFLPKRTRSNNSQTTLVNSNSTPSFGSPSLETFTFEFSPSLPSLSPSEIFTFELSPSLLSLSPSETLTANVPLRFTQTIPSGSFSLSSSETFTFEIAPSFLRFLVQRDLSNRFTSSSQTDSEYPFLSSSGIFTFEVTQHFLQFLKTRQDFYQSRGCSTIFTFIHPKSLPPRINVYQLHKFSAVYICLEHNKIPASSRNSSKAKQNINQLPNHSTSENFNGISPPSLKSSEDKKDINQLPNRYTSKAPDIIESMREGLHYSSKNISSLSISIKNLQERVAKIERLKLSIIKRCSQDIIGFFNKTLKPSIPEKEDPAIDAVIDQVLEDIKIKGNDNCHSELKSIIDRMKNDLSSTQKDLKDINDYIDQTEQRLFDGLINSKKSSYHKMLNVVCDLSFRFQAIVSLINVIAPSLAFINVIIPFSFVFLICVTSLFILSSKYNGDMGVYNERNYKSNLIKEELKKIKTDMEIFKSIESIDAILELLIYKESIYKEESEEGTEVPAKSSNVNGIENIKSKLEQHLTRIINLSNLPKNYQKKLRNFEYSEFPDMENYAKNIATYINEILQEKNLYFSAKAVDATLITRMVFGISENSTYKSVLKGLIFHTIQNLHSLQILSTEIHAYIDQLESKYLAKPLADRKYITKPPVDPSDSIHYKIVEKIADLCVKLQAIVGLISLIASHSFIFYAIASLTIIFSLCTLYFFISLSVHYINMHLYKKINTDKEKLKEESDEEKLMKERFNKIRDIVKLPESINSMKNELTSFLEIEKEEYVRHCAIA